MITEQDHRDFRNLSIEDQLKYGSVEDWKAGRVTWEIGEDIPEEGEPGWKSAKQDSKQETTLRVIGQRSECARPTILNMDDFMSKHKT